METPGHERADNEVLRMQDGVRDWARRIARLSDRGPRKVPPPVLLSLLCACACCPLLAAGAGVTGAVAVASIGVLSSLGGGVLSGILAGALDRLRSRGDENAPPRRALEDEVAREIEKVLAASEEEARALRAEIAALLRKIDAGGTALRAAIDAGDERVSGGIVAVLSELDMGFQELGFLVSDVAGAAAEIQETLDEQGANVRGIIEQNYRQSTEIRLVREVLAVIESRTRGAGDGGMAGGREPRWPHGCPYRGLLPFRESDHEVFYGRERLTAELAVRVARRAAGGMVVVTGASGAGKTSLVRAGLVPTLARGVQVDGSQHWPCSVITPATDPLTELAAALALLGGGDTARIRDALARAPRDAHLAVRQAVAAGAARRDPGSPPPGPDPAPLVLIVDQFEQVFTLSPETVDQDGAASRQAFITALDAAATTAVGPAGRPAAIVVIAVRGDFWDRCAAYPELARHLQDGQFVVGPMAGPDLRLAITGPADAAGLDIDDSLADAIVSDLHAAGGGDVGALPLLSQAMLLTWENRDGDRLTSHGYAQAGGVSRAVQTSADAAYNALAAEQQAAARDILRSMTVTGRDGQVNRRPVDRADLYAAHPGARAHIDVVLETFAARRLIVLDAGSAQIAHDALLRGWPRLRGWLEDDQASWILHAQLSAAAADWRDKHEDPSFLYRGTRLSAIRQAAARWAADPGRFPALTATEREFVHASERAAARGTRRRRAVAVALVLLLIASFTGAGIAVSAARNADKQRTLAVSGELAAESETLDGSAPPAAAELAAAAWRMAQTPQARQSLLGIFAQPGRAVFGAGGDADAVAFSPDGRLLATAGTIGTARLWDVATGRQGGSLTADRAAVNAVAFSPNGRLLATASSDSTARLWDVATHRQVGAAMTADNELLTAVAFSPNGKLLATASKDGTARLWDVATHRQVGGPLTADGEQVNAVAFSPDGTLLATASNDGTARLWNVATHRQVGGPLTAGKSVMSAVAFSPDGRLLATGSWDGTARLWNVATGQQVGGPLTADSQTVNGVAFSPDGTLLATASDDGTARLWDTEVGRQVGASMDAGGCGCHVSGVAFSPDGRLLATVNWGGTAALWDVATQRLIAALPNGGNLLTAVAFSPNGRLLATASLDGTVQLWDVATHREVGAPLAAGTDYLFGLAFSPDGRLLATASLDGTARLWDVATHRQVGAPLITVHHGLMLAVAFSPDGRLLAAASSDGTVWLIDVATHRRVGRPLIGDGSPVNAVAFSPDGAMLAAADGDGSAWLWNVATGRQIGGPLIADDSDLSGVAFSPDGTLLATASFDGTARLWDVATGQQLGGPLTADSRFVNGVAFSPNGTLLATASDDGTARLWGVAMPGDLLNAVCAIAGDTPLARQAWDSLVQYEPYQPSCP
jgi:WD40 repeat protein